MVLPSAVISTVAVVAVGDSSVTSTGKCSPLKTCPGKPTDSSSSPGLGWPASGTVSIGMPSCCACQMARATLPRFSLPSETSTHARHHAGGHGRYAVADRRLQIGAVSRRAGGMAQLPAVLGVFVERRVRASRGRRESRASSGGRAHLPPCRRSADSRLQILRRHAGRSVGQHGHRHFGFGRRSCAARTAPAGSQRNVPAFSSERGAARRIAPLPRQPRRSGSSNEQAAPRDGRKSSVHLLPPPRRRMRIAQMDEPREHAEAAVQHPLRQQTRRRPAMPATATDR